MLFNSVEFAIFLPVVFFFYWFVVQRRLKLQNIFLIAASYFFYGWWDWRFLLLIIISSFTDYLVGIGLAQSDNERRRKHLLLISVAVNIGILGFFKYFNFFAENFSQVFTLLGRPITDSLTLKIILPIGISFYTFQTLSYSIDVYRRKCEPTRDIIAFFAFVSFFPQLVAGPIERATNLLPQFHKKRSFEYSKAVDGMRQILCGLFKKLVIADNCAHHVNEIFMFYTDYSGSTLFLGAVLFAFQIYGDFSGYSDIAIGTGRLFGFKLMRNFAYPYFSRDIAEFWRRWHISLSTWFRDYVYIPLGGSRGGARMKVRNTFAIFLVSGLWHGAHWKFMTWGLLHAIYFLPLILMNKHRAYLDQVAKEKRFPSIKELLQMGGTFFLTTVAWVFFRADSSEHAIHYLRQMFHISFFSIPQISLNSLTWMLLLFIAVEWFQRDKQHALELDGIHLPKIVRWGIYYGVCLMIIKFVGVQQEFVYFQF